MASHIAEDEIVIDQECATDDDGYKPAAIAEASAQADEQTDADQQHLPRKQPAWHWYVETSGQGQAAHNKQENPRPHMAVVVSLAAPAFPALSAPLTPVFSESAHILCFYFYVKL